MYPNTNVLAGKLNEKDLENFLEVYSKIGLNIKATLPSIDSINELNKNLRECEITPNPFGEGDNKLIIGIKYKCDGNLYVATTISPGENSIKNPDELKERYYQSIKKIYGIR